MNEPKNVAASVRERLRQRAAAEKRPFDEVLTYYAMERFLYRLSMTAHRDRFVLKGALMLPLWGTKIARATRDIDLLGQGNPTPAEIAAVIADCVAAEVPPDGLVFDASSIETGEIRESERYGGIRATFQATLERARIKMQVDVGLGDAVTPAVVEITYPALLEQPAPVLVGYPVETAIAEKLEAVVDLGLANSRMKDFFDLWILLGSLELDGDAVTKAVRATFARRGTPIPVDAPIGLTPEFAIDSNKQKQWAAFVRRVRLTEAPDLSEVIRRIESFAMPVFRGPARTRWVRGQWT